MFVSDEYPPIFGGTTLNIGNSRDGNAVAYSLPRSGYEPMLVSRMFTIWTSECDCVYGGPQALTVGPYPYPVDPPSKPRGVRYPDSHLIDAVGMTSLLCPGPVSTHGVDVGWDQGAVPVVMWQ
jgi:hypothetical protein